MGWRTQERGGGGGWEQLCFSWLSDEYEAPHNNRINLHSAHVHRFLKDLYLVKDAVVLYI